jgi:hypothetical protein
MAHTPSILPLKALGRYIADDALSIVIGFNVEPFRGHRQHYGVHGVDILTT